MKILFLVTDALGMSGGIARYNQDLMIALTKLTAIHAIEVLPINGGDGQQLQKISQLSSVDNKWLYAVKGLVTARRFKPDILFCGHLNLLPLGWIISQVTGAIIWLQIHGIDAWEKPNCITTRLVENVNFITCVSRYTRRRFLSWASINPSRVKVLPNTVSAPYGYTVDKSYSESLGIGGKKVMLTVGRLSASERYKGHDQVIKCLPMLLNEFPDICYLIAGDGDDRERLEEIAVQYGVAATVKFLGKVTDEQLTSLYSIADLFVMPSTGEGFGIVFLEAMAFGKKALGLGCDGSIDPLQDGHLGAVASREKLCDDICHALNTPSPKDLADRVQLIFGEKKFQGHVLQLFKTEYLRLPE